MNFDLEHCLAIVHSHPIGHCSPSLINWFRDIGIPGSRIAITWNERLGIIAQYNTAIKYTALKSKAPCFIFADNDMSPHKITAQPFLELDTDLSCIEYQTELPHTRAWGMGCAFHTGIWKVRREVLERLDPPWFRYEVIDDGCQATGCICNDFVQRAMEMGFTVSHGGYAKHTPRKRVNA